MLSNKNVPNKMPLGQNATGIITTSGISSCVILPGHRNKITGPFARSLYSGYFSVTFFDRLEFGGNYSATSNHVKCKEGTGRSLSPPRPLLAVPNATAHPSAASVLGVLTVMGRMPNDKHPMNLKR